MEKKFSLKDELFNSKKVQMIAKEIKEVHSAFESLSFSREVIDKFPELELKERIYHIRDMLKKYLVDDYKKSVRILLDALPDELDSSKSDDDFGDFI
ncbi:MAG: hypothetical protein Q9M34_02925, partial [Sulfurimonas sp.]|nr:hypothetical protein [Sulfurimonas sp.]